MNDINGWSPRYHQVERIGDEWEVSTDTAMESLFQVWDVLVDIVHDYDEETQ